jgi:hypothetical protein
LWILLKAKTCSTKQRRLTSTAVEVCLSFP